MALLLRDSVPESALHSSPYSLVPMDSATKHGLYAVGLFAAISVACTSSLLLWITYRLIFWKKYHRSYVGYNQNIILIYQLLLADLQQSIGFVISFHWISQNEIVGPSPVCFAQGWFIHLGDVASGFFVLCIALHTCLSVVYARKIPYTWFVGGIAFVWAISVLLTIIGPITHGQHFFLRAGSWCWVSSNHETSRLTLHYLWIFIDEFGTLITYALVFWHLRKQITSLVHSDVVSKATRCMILYPLAYVFLTLPLATGRMAAMSGHTFPKSYYLAAGSLITSCGWVDCLLYSLTRRVIISSELNRTSEPQTRSSGYPAKRHKPDYEEESDGKCSTDSIIGNAMRLGDIKAETTVEVTISDGNYGHLRQENFNRGG